MLELQLVLISLHFNGEVQHVNKPLPGDCMNVAACNNYQIEIITPHFERIYFLYVKNNDQVKIWRVMYFK